MTHTPYDGSSKPFTIGLKPLDITDWIEIDRHLPAYLDEKQRLLGTVRDKILASEPGTEGSQREILDALVAHLLSIFPNTYRLNDRTMEIIPAKRTVNLDHPTLPVLHIAASLIQEDLVLMRGGANGWRLAAASLCFPSAWNLHEKFGKPIHEIHKPVPGFGEGTRNAELIARMFDKLQPNQPVIRWNWSLYGDANLYHPVSDHGMKRRFGEKGDQIVLRLERQTLRKMPVSGDLLFTIRIHNDPLEILESHPDGGKLASAIAAQVAAFSASEVAYKGIEDEREALLTRLNRIAGLPRPI